MGLGELSTAQWKAKAGIRARCGSPLHCLPHWPGEGVSAVGSRKLQVAVMVLMDLSMKIGEEQKGPRGE